jgi:hypothetical protein
VDDDISRCAGEKGRLFGRSARAGAAGATCWTAATTLPAPWAVLCARFWPSGLLAVECSIGFSERSLALVDPTAAVMVHLPRSYREDGNSWRPMASFDWSPTSNAPCVCYHDGTVEIFERAAQLALSS